MSITKAERTLIRKLMRDDGWTALLSFVAMKVDSWKDAGISGRTAFEELRMLHTRDGKIQGVKELFDEIDRLE